MTTATWPPGLPDYVLEQGYSEQLEDQTIESTVEAGLAKVRRRFTAPVRRFQVSLQMDAAQAAIFEAFFLDTLQGGSLPFEWRHPRTGAATRFRFRKPVPSITVFGGIDVRVQMVIEAIPS